MTDSVARTIAVITNVPHAFERRLYLIQLLLRSLASTGVRVVVIGDKASYVPAALAILHVDLSVVPRGLYHLAGRYPHVINGRVTDIRKHTFSTCLVPGRTETAGPVIVKTNLNYGGRPEMTHRSIEWALRHGADRNAALQRFEAREDRRGWRSKRLLRDYPVYESASAVPGEVWRNRRLVVEQFLPERHGDEYRCRHWLFCGASEVQRITVSRDPTVKLAGRPQLLDEPVPEVLRQARAALGFDYGKFDYGLVAGRVVLYDVNRTPGRLLPEQHTDTVEKLTPGLATILSNCS